MASSEVVNPRLIKSNVDLYMKILKRPMVNEKLLARPPFKFLHDVITLIIKSNGYLRGLYTEDQFQLDNINTKEAKTAFLDRLIDAVGFIYGKAADVKSAKIVAGLEVAKTNKFLNDLAKAVTDRKPFLDAVNRVRKGEKPPEGKGTTSTTAPTTKTTASTGVKKPGVPATRAGAPGAGRQPAAKGKTTTTTTPQTRPGVKAKVPEQKKPEPVKQPEKSPEPERPKTQEIRKVDQELESELDELDTTENVQPEEQSQIEQTDVQEDSLKNSSAESYTVSQTKQAEVEVENEKEDESETNEQQQSLPEEPTKVPEAASHQKIEKAEEKHSAKHPPSEPVETVKPQQRQRTSRPPPPQVDREKTAAPASIRSARPGSSRPAPPRVMTASRNRLQRMLDNRMTSAKQQPSSPQIWPPPEGLKLELNVDLDDDEGGDDFTMNSQKLQDTLFSATMDNDVENLHRQPTAIGVGGGDDGAISDSPSSGIDGKGKLMQQLMANKSQLAGADPHRPSAPTTPSTAPTDTHQLRAFIRELCQSVATLTKATNYLHEDVDPMVAELSQWHQEYRSNLQQIEALRTETERQLEPLRQELENVDREVEEFRDKLQGAKTNAFRNSATIAKLIESI